MLNKNYIYIALVAVLIVVTAFALVNKDDGGTDDSLGIFPSPTPTPTPVLSSAPSPSIKPIATSKPSPNITVKEESYEYLAYKFDNDGNRRLILNEECTALVPSQVAYKNNVQIMLDNSYSTKPHILKIGGREYSIDAGAWYLTTLSSPTVPASLQIFCGSMELGQIDLI